MPSRRATDTIDISIRWRCDIVTVRLSDSTIRINFSAPMESDRYAVFLNPSMNLIVPDINKDARGFTINVSLSFSGEIEWLAIPYN